MKKGILFDLDGTLLDTLEDLYTAVNYALARFGYPERTWQEVRCFVGNGAGNLIARAVPEGADPKPVLDVFRTWYDAHCQVKTGPYPGIPEALEALAKKYPIAIVSNKPDSAVKTLCAEYFPGVYALGEQAGCPRKPAPDMFFRAMEAIGVERCAYVGDSEVDVTTGRNAGVPVLSVTWGFRDWEQLVAAGGEIFCDDPRKLPEMIEKIL